VSWKHQVTEAQFNQSDVNYVTDFVLHIGEAEVESWNGLDWKGP